MGESKAALLAGCVSVCRIENCGCSGGGLMSGFVHTRQLVGRIGKNGDKSRASAAMRVLPQNVSAGSRVEDKSVSCMP